jgi:hypothetical protein
MHAGSASTGPAYTESETELQEAYVHHSFSFADFAVAWSVANLAV